MNVLSLCSGIGGLELGIEAAGVEVESCVYVESDPYAAAVLAARVASGALAEGRVLVADLRTLSVGPGEFDLITAGFPCQPASVAGSRKGRRDERWIWPAIADLIEAARPRYMLLENVRGLLTVDAGAGFREVLERLAACGLDARWTCVRASDAGAPHRRERVFLLARRSDVGPERVRDAERDAVWDLSERGSGAARAADGGDTESRHLGGEVADATQPRCERSAAEARGDVPPESGRSVAHADSRRCEGERLAEHGDEQGTRGRLALGHGDDGRLGWPPGPKDAEGWERWLEAGGPAPAVGGRLSAEFVEALMGFSPGWTDLGCGPAARRERLRCLGNAVVPAQAALAWRMLA